MKIRTLILLIFNSLIICIVLVLSFMFYNSFKTVLDNRIFQHLNSIKNLKRIQIETYLNDEWQAFLNMDIAHNLAKEQIDFDTQLADSIMEEGIYDLTAFDPSKKMTVFMVKYVDDKKYVKKIPPDRINYILMERTGMGKSGESYLVGSDFYMRSVSRFIKEQDKLPILVKTIGVQQGMREKAEQKTKKEIGIYKDYRGVPVYGVYEKVEISHLEWVILSEIDVEEVRKPLVQLQFKLIIFSIVIILIAILLGLFLVRLIVKPIQKIKNLLGLMEKGNYEWEENLDFLTSEDRDMSKALFQLKESLIGAINFSMRIGEMDLEADYTPKSENDKLGESLLLMRDRQIEFSKKEASYQKQNKQSLLEGLEEERARLSRDLHDGIGPLLTTLKLYIQKHQFEEKKREQMMKIVDQTIVEIRTMSSKLHPTTIKNFGVGATINDFINTISPTTTVNIIFDDETISSTSKITPNMAIHIYRISQELINNSVKHAVAENIHLTITEFEDFLIMDYIDDGIGFDEEKIKKGSGLRNIRDRVDILGGKVKLNYKKDSMIFEIEIPFK